MGPCGAEPTGVQDRQLRKFFRPQILQTADGRLSARRSPEAALKALAALEKEVDLLHFRCEKPRRGALLRCAQASEEPSSRSGPPTS
eukprot:5331339-Alexandrium_andersonii.AAC.1